MDKSIIVYTNLRALNQRKVKCDRCRQPTKKGHGHRWSADDYYHGRRRPYAIHLCDACHAMMGIALGTIVTFHFGGSVARIGKRTYTGVTRTSQSRLHECCRIHAMDVSFHQGGWGFTVKRDRHAAC